MRAILGLPVLFAMFNAPVACAQSTPSAPAKGAPAQGAPAQTAPAQAAPAASRAIPRVSVQRIVPKVPMLRPVQVVFEPGNDERMYIVEQPGRIFMVNPNDAEATEAKLVLDISDPVNSASNEEGLLSMVFHPKFAQNHQVYLYYAILKEGRKRYTRLSRWQFDPAAHTIKPDSEEVIMDILHPYWNHKGGTALFGPDGMLYLSIGDGGAANDPHGAGQNLGSLLAKVLRIDVDHADGDKKYSIPKDNPFVSTPNARPEVWAFGLRNIWRMSFDRKTGELYGGDVGQNLYEEIDIIRKGGNYGWNPREGTHAFSGGKPGDFGSDFIEPIVDYPRNEGVSVTGGYVYRGTKYPALDGVYLYADLASCRMWGLRAEDAKLVAGPEQVAQTRGHLPTSFGEANDGTLYLVTFEGGQDSNAKGGVWRISAAAK